MNKSQDLNDLVLEAKIPEEDLEQIFSIVQDGSDPDGAILNLGKKLRIKPEDVKKAFKNKFGKDPETMASELAPDEEPEED